MRTKQSRYPLNSALSQQRVILLNDCHRIRQLNFALSQQLAVTLNDCHLIRTLNSALSQQRAVPLNDRDLIRRPICVTQRRRRYVKREAAEKREHKKQEEKIKKDAAAAEKKAAKEAEKSKAEIKKDAAAEKKDAEEAEKSKGETPQTSGGGAEVPIKSKAKRKLAADTTEGKKVKKTKETDNAADVKVFDKGAIVAAFRIQHERSINQFLFRAPPEWKGGPGSKSFRYEEASDESMETAKKDCLQYLRDQCAAMGQEVPLKFR